jgi:hypothetical protein
MIFGDSWYPRAPLHSSRWKFNSFSHKGDRQDNDTDPNTQRELLRRDYRIWLAQQSMLASYTVYRRTAIITINHGDGWINGWFQIVSYFPHLLSRDNWRLFPIKKHKGASRASCARRASQRTAHTHTHIGPIIPCSLHIRISAFIDAWFYYCVASVQSSYLQTDIRRCSLPGAGPWVDSNRPSKISQKRSRRMRAQHPLRHCCINGLFERTWISQVHIVGGPTTCESS